MAYQVENLDILTAAELLISKPTDVMQIQHLREDLESVLKEPCRAVDLFLDSFERFHRHRLVHIPQIDTTALTTETDTNTKTAAIAALIARKSTEQRTPEWYIQASKLLTASELGGLFGSPRARGQLVMAKAVPPTPEDIERRCSKPLTCLSQHMSPFDWGIRFEPVVKQIYEHRHHVQIADLGRLVHPRDSRMAASPDGLIAVADVNNAAAVKRLGALVEIKCPITREIENDKVPADYYTQMQLQLEVTDVDVCYYVEAKFRSTAPSRYLTAEGAGMFSGVIWLVEHLDPNTQKETRRYVYGPVGYDGEDPPCHMTGQHDYVIERIPWTLMGWHEMEVRRSADWWTALQPRLEVFWEDVEKARAGEFIVPAAMGGRGKKATVTMATGMTEADEDVCQIQLVATGCPLSI
jgi:hypothetical protein